MFNQKRGNSRRIFFMSVLIIFIFILVLEGGTRLFLYFTRGLSTVGLPERRVYLRYQPFIMFGDDLDRALTPSKYSGIKYGARAYRVLLLGASTAADFPKSILEKAFSDKFPGRKFEMIKAACGGYNARQELIVAAIWGTELEPDIIITLDGGELVDRLVMEKAGTFYLNSAYKLVFTRPFLSPLVHILRQSQFIHALGRLYARITIGPVQQYTDAIPVYISAQHSINLLAKGLSAARIMVLAPFMAFKEPLSQAEANFKHYKYREQVTKELYNMLHEKLMALAKKDGVLYIDGRHAFDGINGTIFSDDFHFVNDEGYQILAKYIANFVTEEDLKNTIIAQ